MKNRIQVIGTGNQAGYGIGEIIADYANTNAGCIKAMRKAAYWYTPARILAANDSYVDICWSIIRKQDKGYTVNSR